MKKILTVVLTMLFVVGCAVPKLSSKAHLVIVSTPEQVRGCQYVGPVSAKAGSNFRDYDTNVGIVDIELRNKAALMGGTNIVVNPPSTTSEIPGLFGGSSGVCANCVQMSGLVYRCN